MEPLIEFFFPSAFVFHSYSSYIGKFSHFKNCFKINTFLAYCIFKAWIRSARERESRASDYLSQEIISALAFLWIYWNQFPCHSSFSLLLSLSFFIEDSPAFRNLVRANLVKRFTSFSMGSFKSVIRCFPFSITSIYSSHVSVLANWCVCADGEGRRKGEASPKTKGTEIMEVLLKVWSNTITCVIWSIVLD